MIIYPQNAELPDLGVTWNNSAGVPFDFTSGWTLQCDVSGYYPNTGTPLKFTKTTGITLYPNLITPMAKKVAKNNDLCYLSLCQ